MIGLPDQLSREAEQLEPRPRSHRRRSLSCTCTIASLERCSTISNWRLASCADLSVLFNARSSRNERSSRNITAWSRAVVWRVRRSRVRRICHGCRDPSSSAASLTETAMTGSLGGNLIPKCYHATEVFAAGDMDQQLGVDLLDRVCQVT